MINVQELRRRIDGMYAPPGSDEAQEVIHQEGETHVTEVWEDGELTITKSGDLYGQRRVHQTERPFLPVGQVLFPPEDLPGGVDQYTKLTRGKNHQRMVVVDGELLDVLAEYRNFVVDKETIRADRVDQTGVDCPVCSTEMVSPRADAGVIVLQCPECETVAHAERHDHEIGVIDTWPME